MASTHTPGPWKIPPTEWAEVGGDDFTEWAQVEDAQGNCVACVDSEANACLIAAAPELLEALELIVNSWTEQANLGDTLTPWVTERLFVARKALKKAKGQH